MPRIFLLPWAIVVDAIPNSGVSELAEIGQIFSHLSVGEAEAAAELFAGDGFAAACVGSPPV